MNKNACRTCSTIIFSSFRACLIYMRRASPVRRTGPVKGLKCLPVTGMNFRNLFTCLVTVEVTHGVTGGFSCFDSKRRFILALASTEWYFKTKDAKIIL